MSSISDDADSLTSKGQRRWSTVVRRANPGIFGFLITIVADIVTIGTMSALPLVIAARERTVSKPASNAWTVEAPVVSMVFVILGICMILALYFRGHYSRPTFYFAALRHLYGFAFYSFIISLAVILGSDAPAAYYWLPAIWLIVPPVVLTTRFTVNSVIRHSGLEPTRLLIVGSSTGVQDLIAAFGADQLNGYRIAGTLDVRSLVGTAQSSKSLIRNGLERVGADFLIVSLHDCDAELRDAVLDVLARETIPFALVSDFVDLQLYGYDTCYYMSDPPITLMFRDNLHYPVRRGLKAAFDRSLALIAIIFLLPLAALVALAVAADGGPIFFIHTRIGQNGRRFGCLKFRSMAVDSDQILARVLATNQAAAAEWDRTRKLRHDPRITRVGRLLRRTSLDELPQLLNVLKGDMSLVGPRPIVDAEITRYGRDMELYYRFRPGITGLWQVSGRSDTTYAQRVALDAWYVKNWSFRHDFVILIKTLPVLLRRSGAV